MIRYALNVHLPNLRDLTALLLFTASGCAAADAATGEALREVSSHEQAIVYGEDDRQELYQVEDPVLREIGRSSVAALIKKEAVHRLASGEVRVSPTSLTEIYRLCPGQRFERQPAAATCSAVLIDKDLMITAGHCVESDEDCKTYSFVFDYAYKTEGQLENISGSDVYGCRRIVSRTFTETRADFAIVQLDRVPTARSPIPVRRSAMGIEEPLTTMGFTSGLPLKVDQGAVVQDARSTLYDFFALNSDTFEGSSGSAVLDQNYELAGVLVRGGKDYTETSSGCAVVTVVPPDAGIPEWRWEQATYAGPAVDALCAEGYPSEHLCRIAPSCGDGVCSPDPVDEDCAVDCAEFCRENACTKGLGSAVPGAPVKSPSEDAEGCSVRGASASRTGGISAVAMCMLGLVWGLRRRRRAPSPRAR